MSQIKCYDVVRAVLDDASEQFMPVWKEKAVSEDILHQYCDTIDKFIDEFDATCLAVEVDEESMDIRISFECEEMIIRDANHMFYQIATRSECVKFRYVGEDKMEVEFSFPSIWERG